MPVQRKTVATHSSRDNGYEVQFDEIKGSIFVCRECLLHPLRQGARMSRVGSVIRHLECHEEDGHHFDEGALVKFRGRQ